MARIVPYGFLTAIALAILACAPAIGAVNIFGYWWENPMPFQRTPKGLGSIRAEDCGVCHAEIYREWKSSAHAHAISDLQFQAELAKSPQANWLCYNCHTPLRNQIAQIAVSVRNRSTSQPLFEQNTGADAVLRAEGVTCAVCHVKEGVIVGPYGDTRAPHPVRRDPKLLNIDACASCHQATAAYTDTLVCTFDTAEEWKASPYAAKGQTCSNCHMPSVQRPLATGTPVRAVRRHSFAGSTIAKNMNESAPVQPSGLDVELVHAERQRDQISVQMKLTNARAGHKLPTGDPERNIRVEIKLIGGQQVMESKSLRIGQQWEWWPKARRIADNRLKPLEQRLETVRFAKPRADGDLQLGIDVYNVRMSKEAAGYHHLLGQYPIEARVQSFVIPLRPAERTALNLRKQ
jgi:hypothetical protein